MPKLIDIQGYGVVEFPDEMDDAAISRAIETELAPKLRAQSSAEIDRVMAPVTPPSARLPQPVAAPVAPPSSRPMPIPGTFDPRTGQALPPPGIPIPQPAMRTVDPLAGLPINPDVNPVDALMRAGSMATMGGMVGGAGTAAKVLGGKIREFDEKTTLPGQNPGMVGRIGAGLEAAGEGIREFARKNTDQPAIDYAAASPVENPALLLDPVYMAHQLGNAGGSMLGFMVPFVGTLSSSPVRGLVGMSGLESLVNAAEAHDRTLEKGGTPQEAMDAYLKNAAMDFPFTLATNAANPILDDLLDAKPLAKGVFGPAMEAGQEMGQGAIGRYATGDPLDDGLAVEALGGILGAPVAAGLRAGTQQQPQQPPELPPLPYEPPPQPPSVQPPPVALPPQGVPPNIPAPPPPGVSDVRDDLAPPGATPPQQQQPPPVPIPQPEPSPAPAPAPPVAPPVPQPPPPVETPQPPPPVEPPPAPQPPPVEPPPQVLPPEEQGPEGPTTEPTPEPQPPAPDEVEPPPAPDDPDTRLLSAIGDRWMNLEDVAAQGFSTQELVSAVRRGVIVEATDKRGRYFFARAGTQRTEGLLPPPPLRRPPQPPPTPQPEPPPQDDTPERRLLKRVDQALTNNEDISRGFERLAEEAYGGTRAEGKFQMKRAYDAMEAGVNAFLSRIGKDLMTRRTDVPDPIPNRPSPIQRLRHLMAKLPTQRVRSQEQIELQQFSTPPTLSWLAGRALAPRADDVVLEPSAGTGSLTAMIRPVVKRVMVNELDPGRRALLEAQGYENVTSVDAEFLNGTLEAAGITEKPTAIIMNPPFSSTGGRVKNNKNKFGHSHILQALDRLAPGGRLVAILGEGTTMTAPTARNLWAQVRKSAAIRANIGISGKEYAKYGTTFGNRIIVLDKTGPSTEAPVEGNFETIEEAWNALSNVANSRPASMAEQPQPGPGVGDSGQSPEQVPGDRRPTPEPTEDGSGGDAGVGGQPGTRGPLPPRKRPDGRKPETEPAPDPGVQPPVQPEGTGGKQPVQDPGSGVQRPGEQRLNPPTEAEIDAKARELAKQAAAEARKRLEERRRKQQDEGGPTLGMGEVEDTYSEEDIPDLASVASDYFAEGMKPKDLRARMVEEFGPGIRPLLPDIMDAALEQWQDLRAQARQSFGQSEKPTEKPTKKFSSTQVDMPAAVSGSILDASRSFIAENDLAGDGRETEPHVTVKYGLHTENAEDVRRVLAGEPPIRIKVGKVSTFPPSESSDGAAVIKLNIESDDLHRLNKKIAEALEHTDTFPDYKPHLTLAYVAEPAASKYAGKELPGITGQEFTLNSITFSSKTGEKTTISLTPPKEKKTERGEQEDDDDTGNFVKYEPSIDGPKHPGQLVETRVMASVESPEVTYVPDFPESVLKEGRLSAAQLEAIAFAGQANQEVVDGKRQGVLIGDGTGVGKGRELAGFIWDNNRRGRKKAIWVSANKELLKDAKRDFAGIGALKLDENGEVTESEIGKLQRQNDWSGGEAIDMKEGVVFTTYATLRSKQAGERGKSRLEQLKEWAGEDAVIVFDEVHLAKNAQTDSGEEGSQSGKVTAQIQEEIPLSYIMYASATFASEVRHLSTLERLGLWGQKTAFPGFSEFMVELARGGVAALELISRELKAGGRYLSRSISYKGVNYEEVSHALTKEQRQTYTTAAEAWQTVLRAMVDQLESNGAGRTGRARSSIEQRLWNDHQRFFRSLLTAMKLPTVIAMAEKAIDEGNSVVISLIGTGAAQAEREIARAEQEGDAGIDFSPREILLNFIDQYYPTQLWEEYTDDQGKTHSRPVIRDGKKVENPAAVEARDALKNKVKSDLLLPDAPLQAIVNHFGRNKVAELTGRKDEPYYDEKTGKLTRRSRAPEGVPKDKVNDHEMQQFQAGKKNVAVISKAAGTGISLHADLAAKNQTKRVHIVMELSWSADDQMQSFGRTHRSNQKQPPEYYIVSTDIGGERRFSSTIAKRLDALGALTKGQRGSAGAGVLAKYNFEIEQGQTAAEQFYENMMAGLPNLEHNDPHDVLVKMGVTERGSDGTINNIPPQTKKSVTRLLNRILNLAPDEQNEVYDYFVRVFESVVDRAIQAGTLDTGVKTITADEITVDEERVIYKDPNSKARTIRYRILAKRKNKPVSVESAKNWVSRDGTIMVNNEGEVILARRTDLSVTDARTGTVQRLYIVVRPEHWSENEMPETITEQELNASWAKYGAASEKSWHDAVREEKEVEAARKQKKDDAEQWFKARKEVEKQQKEGKDLSKIEVQVIPDQYWSNYPGRYILDTAERFDEEIERLKQREDEVAEKKVLYRDEFRKSQEEGRWEAWRTASESAGPTRQDVIHMIGGSVLGVWQHINPSGGRLDIRMAYPKGRPSIVGIVMNERQAARVERAISGEAPTISAEEVARTVLEDQEPVRLEGGFTLRRATIGRRAMIRVYHASESKLSPLRRIGVLFEQVAWDKVYYIPAGEAGIPILDELLSKHPVEQEDEGGGTASFVGPSIARRAFRRLMGKGSNASATTATLTTVERRSRIIRDLAVTFDRLPVLVGRIRQRKAGGIYKVIPQVIRLKRANDVRVFAHELGHHIHQFLWGTGIRKYNLNSTPLRRFASELRDLDYDQKKRRLHEGFAEFMRLWITEPAEALRLAPKFHAHFEQILDGYPDLKAALENGRQQWEKWNAMPAAGRVLGSIDKTTQTEDKRPWYKLWHRNFDEFYTNYVDRLLPIRRFVEHLQKRGVMWQDVDPYQLARLMAGWWGKANEFLYEGTFDAATLATRGRSLKAILEPIARSGRKLGPASRRILNNVEAEDYYDEGLDDLRVYLVAQRVLEKGNQGIQTGITMDDARHALMDMEALDPGRYKEIQAAADALYAYQDDLLEYAHKQGLFSREALTRIRRMNIAYVPFYRAFDPEERRTGGGPAGSQSLSNVADPAKKMKGSDREILDPISSIIKNTYAIISAADRNHVGQELARHADVLTGTTGAGAFIEEVPGKKYPVFYNLEEIRSTMKAAGLDLTDKDLDVIGNLWRWNEKPNAAEYIVSIVVDGERKLYRTSPEMHQAMTMLDQHTGNLFVKVLAAYAKILRKGATQLNLEFVISNLQRDALTAYFQSEHGFKPGLDTVRGLYHAITKSDLLHEWRRSGGEHAGMVSLDRGALKKTLMDVLGTKGASYYARHPIQAVGDVLSLLGTPGEIAEQATRLGEFRRARRQGASPRLAAFGSRDVSIDFARMGIVGQSLNGIMAFWNAQVQGVDMFLRKHPFRTALGSPDPIIKKNAQRTLQASIIRGIVGSTLPSMLLYWLNKDDEDYQDLPDYIKDFFWLIPTGGYGPSKWIPIPKPFLWGMLYGTTAERMMDASIRKDPDAWKGFAKSVGASAGLGVNFILPTGVLALASLLSNYEFHTGQAIDSPFDKRSPSRRAKPGTSEFSRSVAKVAADRFGLEVSPNKIDAAIFQTTAGLGKTAVRVVDWMMPGRDGNARPAMPVSQWPIVRKFTVPETSAGKAYDKFRDRIGKLEEKTQNHRQDKTEPALTSNETDELRRLRRYAAEMAKRRRLMNEVRNDKSLSAEEKLDKITALRKQEVKITRIAMDPQKTDAQKSVAIAALN